MRIVLTPSAIVVIDAKGDEHIHGITPHQYECYISKFSTREPDPNRPAWLNREYVFLGYKHPDGKFDIKAGDPVRIFQHQLRDAGRGVW